MTEDVNKTLNELKGNVNVKKMEIHFLPDGIPAIEVWVRREHYRLEFPSKGFSISRIRKSKAVERESSFDAYEEFIVTVLYHINSKRKPRIRKDESGKFWLWKILNRIRNIWEDDWDADDWDADDDWE